jgi:hypothetical protein
MAKLVFGMNHPAVKITEKLVGVAGFEPATLSCRTG